VGNLTLNGGVTSLSGLSLSFAIDGAGASNSLLTLGSAGLSAMSLTFNLNDLGSNTLAANTAYTLISDAGTFSPGSVTANLLYSTNYTLNTAYGTGGILFSGGVVTFEVETVPEPSTWALMFCGLGLLVACQRARRHKNV
jgi:hypothetical protein